MERREPKSLQSLLPRVLSRLAEESGKGRPLAPLWEAVVGPHIARHSTPHSLRRGTLVVTVESAEWALNLSRQEAELRARLNEHLGAGTVTALEFQPEAR
jgi:predicted nucleic acid-binding Zn ribbon protein